MVACVVAAIATMSASPPGRPSEGVGHYLRDVVYGALDGVITTLAIVSGTMGADLEPRVGIILGIANLTADGISMGASNYLGLVSELQQTGGSVRAEKPWRHGLATAIAFATVGTAPLLAYVVPRPARWGLFGMAIALSAVTLAVVGVLRARYVGKAVWRSASEVLVIGSLAAASAYAIGSAVAKVAQ